MTGATLATSTYGYNIWTNVVSPYLPKAGGPCDGQSFSASAGDAANLSPSPQTARVRLTTGALALVDPVGRQATLVAGDAEQADVFVHPFLSTAATFFAHWDGREPFHGGAYAVDGAAIAVLADREAGKSTTLAALARAGVPVLSDDLVVVDDGVVHAGPRCLDLRPSAAELLGVRAHAALVRDGERLRLTLSEAPATARLAGWVTLAWGDDLRVEPLTPVERLSLLADNRAIALPPGRPAAALDLVALPAWRVSRPRDPSSLDAVVATLRALLD